MYLQCLYHRTKKYKYKRGFRMETVHIFLVNQKHTASLRRMTSKLTEMFNIYMYKIYTLYIHDIILTIYMIYIRYIYIYIYIYMI